MVFAKAAEDVLREFTSRLLGFPYANINRLLHEFKKKKELVIAIRFYGYIHLVQCLFLCEYSTGSCAAVAKAGLPGLLPTLGLGPGWSQQNANFPSLHSGSWGWLIHCRTPFMNSGIPWKSCIGLIDGMGMFIPEGIEMSTPPSPLSIKNAVLWLSLSFIFVERSNWGFGETCKRDGFNTESAK